MKTTLFFAILLAMTGRQSIAQGIPVHMIVTAEPHHIQDVPTINREDVIVYQGKDRVRATGWVPLKGDRAGLQLYIVIDDGVDTSVGTQFDDLRKFIQAQPATTL